MTLRLLVTFGMSFDGVCLELDAKIHTNSVVTKNPSTWVNFDMYIDL
jgi:hypothetical protein